METTEETRKEIERRSQYFDGIPPENWIFLGMKENKKNYIRYYQDEHGNYHHTSAPKKRPYNPYKVEISRGSDGTETARIIHKKTGKPHPAMLR